MAAIGLKYFAWAKMATEPADAIPTYDPGVVLGKAVSTNLTVTNAEGELYADDMLAEYVSEFVSADFSAETDNITLDKQANLYGAAYNDGEIQFNPGDTAPYGCFGGYQVLMVGGVRKYRAYFFPKAKASIPDWTGATKGNSISFSTQPINMKIMPPEFGPWYYIKEFDTESAAKAYVDSKVGVTAWYNINVQVNGASAGEAVTPVGISAVSSGDSFALTITGTATALYDNGTDNVSAISGGKYTITNVGEDHSIAVIF